MHFSFTILLLTVYINTLYIIGLCSSLVAILMIFLQLCYIHTAHNFWLWLSRIPIYCNICQISLIADTPLFITSLSLLCHWLDTSWSPNQWHYKHMTLVCCLSWTSTLHLPCHTCDVCYNISGMFWAELLKYDSYKLPLHFTLTNMFVKWDDQHIRSMHTIFI